MAQHESGAKVIIHEQRSNIAQGEPDATEVAEKYGPCYK